MIDHGNCEHPKTKAGRAKCRKDRAKAAAPETAHVEETAETVHVVEEVAVQPVEEAAADKPARPSRRSGRAKAEVA